MRLRRGLRVLPHGRGEVQIGTDARWAVRVTDLTDDETAALLALRPDAPLGTLAADERMSASRLADLLDQLADAGLVAPDGTERAATGPAGPDGAVLSLTRPDGAGTATVAARHARTVGVVGLGRTGAGIALTLAAGGVGRIQLEDERPVRSGDVGAFGYRWEDCGAPRATALASAVLEISPRAAVDRYGMAAAPPPADLVVVVAEHALDPALAAGLVSAATPHLLVVVREADTVVGPLVVPGDGPCARCLDLHRTDVDPAWPQVAATLCAGATPPPEPHAVAAVAVGLAAGAVLELVDAGDPARPRHRPLRGATVELSLPTPLPRERRWAVHPSCGCTALPA